MPAHTRGPGDEYEEWEYPDPRDVEELANRPIMDEPRSESRGFASLKMVVVGVVAVSLVASLALPVLLAGGGGSQPAPVSPGRVTTEETAEYSAWLEQSVGAALREWGAQGQARYLGTQFDISATDPVIGVRVDGLDPTTGSAKSAMQSYSIAILGRIFDDGRADSVTLFWYNLAAGADGGQAQLQAAMVVGLVRQTADGIDWASLRAAELAEAVDLYRDLPSTPSEPA